MKNILANFYQPRTKFDREKIKELAESILSNGLINPITVKVDKKRKGKYMICSGERRWQAHKIANLKTIPAFVKEYKSEGQFMVESLIENIHREDLTPEEKGKFCIDIEKKGNIKNSQQLSILIKSDPGQISDWKDSYLFKKKYKKYKDAPHKIIRSTATLQEKERKNILDFAKKENIVSTDELSKRLSISPTTIKYWFDSEEWKFAKEIAKNSGWIYKEGQYKGQYNLKTMHAELKIKESRLLMLQATFEMRKELREKLPVRVRGKASPTVIRETQGLPEKQRIELVKEAVKEDFGGSKMRQLSTLKKGDLVPEREQARDKAGEVVGVSGRYIDIAEIAGYLNKNPKILQLCRTESVQHKEKLNVQYKNKATARDIIEWLDNGTERVMSKTVIIDRLKIAENLDKNPKVLQSIRTESVRLSNFIKGQQVRTDSVRTSKFSSVDSRYKNKAAARDITINPPQ